MKPTVILNKYFNTQDDPHGYIKRPAGLFATEIKALDSTEKVELTELAAAEMQVEVEWPTS